MTANIQEEVKHIVALHMSRYVTPIPFKLTHYPPFNGIDSNIRIVICYSVACHIKAN